MWNPGYKSHSEAYNTFIIWYDFHRSNLSKEDIKDMLGMIICDLDKPNGEELIKNRLNSYDDTYDVD